MPSLNPFGAESTLSTSGGSLKYYDLKKLASVGPLDKLPFSIKVLLESCLRNLDNFIVNEADVTGLVNWNAAKPANKEVPFKVARVILQDFTGVPCVVDLAAMRHAVKLAGGDPQRINPLVPVDLVIDHSVQVDEYANPLALLHNTETEFSRNRERYEFLKWGQRAFDNFGVVPPGRGIVHQVNLEHLAKVVWTKDGFAFPDTLVGTDSHTTMVNGLGVVGWGVGGIEAEACMLGQPIYIVTPQVVGFRLTGALPEGTTATDLVLYITQILRKHGVVEKFVEFFGPGLASMSLADRATIANMAPEYGATIGFFPVDAQTLKYLRLTGRTEDHVDLVERYSKEQGLWRQDDVEPTFSQVLSLDLGSVTPSLAGPKRPQDRGDMKDVAKSFLAAFAESKPGSVVAKIVPAEGSIATIMQTETSITHGDVVIAAITSCTNTSNPSVMVAAGLVAKKAYEKGLKVPDYVKTSLSPGSRVVTDYFNKAGLTQYLDAIGFATTGYGCMTCIGNSGPLPERISSAIEASNITAVSVLSGNRNFEGRVNPHVKANYLASPPLVVAFALAGTIVTDLSVDPLGAGKDGQPVYLKDIWPTQQEVDDTIAMCIDPQMFVTQYTGVGEKSEAWNEIPVKGGELFEFTPGSTYIQNPPFFGNLASTDLTVHAITGARVLVMVGDSVTTDHISPAGNIKKNSPAGKYLTDNGVSEADFNQYGARRGADQVMVRGTFANIRLKNEMAPGTEGGVTTYLGTQATSRDREGASAAPANDVPPASILALPDGRGSLMSIYDASMEYQKANVPLIVIAGNDYGMGSSRDWAAKGTMLLGVKAVIAQSFERIHRSNLVGMGVLPLVFKPGESRASLGLTGHETFDIFLDNTLAPGQDVVVKYGDKAFVTTCRIDTPVELDYYRNGGILQTVLRKMMRS